jgi:hypothetical protein
MNRRLCVTVPPYGIPHDDTLFIVLSLIHTIVSYERRPGRALLLDLLTAMFRSRRMDERTHGGKRRSNVADITSIGSAPPTERRKKDQAYGHAA